MSGISELLVYKGMTNKHSEDYGAVASAPSKNKSYAMCECGWVEERPSQQECRKCGYTLCWRLDHHAIADLKIEQWRKRHGPGCI